MHICYVDESGTPEVPGTTSHFVLTGLSMPIGFWPAADAQITAVLKTYGLENAEFHTAWFLRSYLEQSRIVGFEAMSWDDRRREVRRSRTSELLRLQKTGGKTHGKTKKLYAHTDPYVHLTLADRRIAANAVADCIAGWDKCFLFAECM